MLNSLTLLLWRRRSRYLTRFKLRSPTLWRLPDMWQYLLPFLYQNQCPTPYTSTFRFPSIYKYPMLKKMTPTKHPSIQPPLVVLFIIKAPVLHTTPVLLTTPALHTTRVLLTTPALHTTLHIPPPQPPSMRLKTPTTPPILPTTNLTSPSTPMVSHLHLASISPRTTITHT
uniref:Uncharacterized protein n=1 Tax=Cacopsylla melanoneura TaxID=428564 RepID=A0A8D8T3T5_9HEMI